MHNIVLATSNPHKKRQPVFVGVGLQKQDEQDKHNDGDVRVLHSKTPQEQKCAR